MSWELYIPPVRPDRNKLTGRFMKGHVPHNKGVEGWQKSLPKRTQLRIAKGWKNVELHRPTIRPDTAGRARKKVVLVTDKGRFCVFDYIGAAAEKVGVQRENISRCCRQNAERAVNLKTGRINTDHKYMGFRWYFESDPIWWDKIEQ